MYLHMTYRTRLLATFFLLGTFAFLTALLPSTSQAQTPYTGFQATYYQGKALQGTPLTSRLEPVINWSYPEGGSPAPGVVPTTNFSARWQGWYYADRAGAWTFTYTADDGARVWLDNQLIIDFWYDHEPLTRVQTLPLGVGYHLLRVEYYQSAGDMTSQLTITPPGAFPDWMGEYFDNPYVLGEPRYRANNVDINFNWGSGAPDPRLPSDNFSVRWTRLYNFAAGSYTFSATADDGIRVWVGDTLAIDGWVPQQAKTYTRTLYLSGVYPLRVEYFEQSGQAVVNFIFQAANSPPPSSSTEAWHGEYYNNAALTPPSKCAQDTPTLAFNWGTTSPGCDIAPQFFSAHWQSTRTTLATGFYTIYLTVDDGARIYVDDNLILDAWHEQAPTNYSATLYLNAGAHAWRVEYFQSTGGAQISINILAGVNPPLPAAAPTGEIIVDALGSGWTQGGTPAAWRTAPGGYGGSALWTDNNAFIQPLYSWGRWYPQVVQPQNYEVFVYIPKGLGTTRSARYLIYHNGQYDTTALAQAAYQDAWVSLGTYYFTGQGGEFVALSDVTYEPFASTKVVWDAIKLTPGKEK